MVNSSAAFSRGHAVATTAVSVQHLCFIISDGRLDMDNRQELRRIVREVTERRMLVVFLIVDVNVDSKDSILNTKPVEFVSDGSVCDTNFV